MQARSNSARTYETKQAGAPPHDLASPRLRRRRDLRFQKTNQSRWNVLDPINRQSYRIGLVEHWLLTRPDGKCSVATLIARLRQEFADLSLSDDQLLSTLATFQRSGLLHGPERAADDAPRGGWQSSIASLVVWQIRGIQPDRCLASLAPHTKILFSNRAVRFWLVLAFLTLLLVMFDFKRLAAQSLSLDWIMHPSTSGMLFVVFVVTRGLHELGHALVCKRFGIRCPDIGLFVILGAPCVYCDVSESWQLPGRWQRAAVAAAGMYVELIVATLAAWLWMTTVEGTVNTLALQTMLVCSVSTLIINANPLMRFDGYYILADWLDEVNLRNKADSCAAGVLYWWLLGIAPATTSLSRTRQRHLLLFSVAGWIYRAGLSVTVATVLIAMYSRWNLPWLGRFLAAAVLISWWGVPAMKLSHDLFQSARKYHRGWRLAIFAGACVALVALLPIPSRQLASGWLQPTESQGVYVGTASRLLTCSARDGQQVKAGEQLFRLQNEQLTTRLVHYRHANEIAAIRLESNTRRRDMHGDEVNLQHYKNQLEETHSWLAGVHRELDGLTLCAPINGRFIAMAANSPGGPSALPQAVMPGSVLTTEGIDGTLPTTWCEPQQLGRFVPAGSLLASICGDEIIAVIPLSEYQLSSVAVGTGVRLRLSAQTRVIRDLKVSSVVQLDELSSPWQQTAAASMNSIAADLSSGTTNRFAAVVRLPTDIRGLPGATVDAVFVAEPTTLAKSAMRWLKANLRLLAD